MKRWNRNIIEKKAAKKTFKAQQQLTLPKANIIPPVLMMHTPPIIQIRSTIICDYLIKEHINEL